jgi:hypothetical protein
VVARYDFGNEGMYTLAGEGFVIDGGPSWMKELSGTFQPDDTLVTSGFDNQVGPLSWERLGTPEIEFGSSCEVDE